MLRAAALLVLGLCIVACALGTRGVQREGLWTRPEAPSPTACTTDAECAGGTVPAEDLCCNDPYTLRAHARAWSDHIEAWRETACEDHACPPAPIPAEPEQCAFDVRCQAGRCVDACGGAP